MKPITKALFTILTLSLIGIAVSYLQPTKIIGVHTMHSGDYIHQDLVIKHPPLSAHRVIVWWKENQSLLKEKYGIPETMKDGSYTLTIWDYGKGYQEYRESRFLDFFTPELHCFDEMKTSENCLDKNDQLIRISKNRQGRVFIYTDSGAFIESENGTLKQLK